MWGQSLMNNLLSDFNKDTDIDGGPHSYSPLMNPTPLALSLLIPPPIISHIYYLFPLETAYDSHNFSGDYYLIG